jgi:tRNA uridine 5-carboxymethylaminomethyl modification enzyme
VAKIRKFLSKIKAEKDVLNAMLEAKGSSRVSQSGIVLPILGRPNITISDFEEYIPGIKTELEKYDRETIEAAEIEVKYEGYIEKEKEMADKMARLEDVKIHPDFDFSHLTSLSSEGREKLKRMRPGSVGQASRISGVSASDISVLLVHLGR